MLSLTFNRRPVSTLSPAPAVPALERDNWTEFNAAWERWKLPAPQVNEKPSPSKKCATPERLSQPISIFTSFLCGRRHTPPPSARPSTGCQQTRTRHWRQPEGRRSLPHLESVVRAPPVSQLDVRRAKQGASCQVKDLMFQKETNTSHHVRRTKDTNRGHSSISAAWLAVRL